jgi:hypothetical protein
MISLSRHLSRLSALLLIFLAACSNPPAPKGIDDQPLRLITSIAPSGVFAGSPGRELIAFGGEGLQLLEVASGERRRLDSRVPLALAWRHDGELLAAAFAGGEQSGQLTVFTRAGTVAEQFDLPGTPVAVAWSQHKDLLVAGYRLQQFKFGGNLAQWLVRVNAAGREQFELGDVTLKPATAEKLRDRLGELLRVSFSPAGDELVVMQLHDPPRFAAYLQLTHRNWQVPAERKLLQLPVQPVVLAWGGDSDTVNYRAGAGSWRALSLWPPAGEQMQAVEPTADLPDAWGVGRSLQRFDSGDYLLAVDGRLYAGTGLPGRLGPTDADRDWTLRRWRFEGLISPEEYQEVRP